MSVLQEPRTHHAGNAGVPRRHSLRLVFLSQVPDDIRLRQHCRSRERFLDRGKNLQIRGLKIGPNTAPSKALTPTSGIASWTAAEASRILADCQGIVNCVPANFLHREFPRQQHRGVGVIREAVCANYCTLPSSQPIGERIRIGLGNQDQHDPDNGEHPESGFLPVPGF